MIMECPKCKSANMTKRGFNKLGKQFWKCKECGRIGTLECDMVNGSKLYHKMTERQIRIFNGLMLGDGFLEKQGLLSCNRSVKDRKYNDFLIDQFKELCSKHIPKDRYQEHNIFEGGIKRKISGSCCVFRTLTTNEFKQFRNIWYDKNGNKILPLDIELTGETFAYWYLDDGNIGIGRNVITLCTNNFTENEVIFLKELIYKTFGLKFNIGRQRHKDSTKGYYLRMYGKENILAFAKVIDLYISPEIGMDEDRISGVDKVPWRNFNNLLYLTNKIALRELKSRL